MLFDDPDDDFRDIEDISEDVESISDEMLEPRAQARLIGHEDIEKNLLELFNSGRNPHAIIFSGPQGIGKATMAFRLARYLLKTSEEEYNNALNGPALFGDIPASAESLAIDHKDPVFSKVSSGGHPDLLTIERLYDDKKDRRKSEVSVDEIRKIAPFMRKTPAVDGGWRIVIVDDADTMNRNSQNSILKILEEPPEKALLILITHRLGALLPTILSRASVMNFRPLPDDRLKDVLAGRNPKLSSDQKDMIVSMAEGSLGRLLSYADEKNVAVIDQAFELLEAAPRFDWTRIQHFSDTLGRGGSPESLQAFQEGLNWACAFILKAKAAEKNLPPGLARFNRLAQEVSLAGWLQICDMLREHFIRVHTGNLDKRFMVMGAYTVFENNV